MQWKILITSYGGNLKLLEMSKRCRLQKEYYKQFGNYKGSGKYSDHYVKWLESEILNLRKTKQEMQTTYSTFKWNGLTVECHGYPDNEEIETLVFKDDNGQEIDAHQLLISLTPSGRNGLVKEPMSEILTLYLEAVAEMRQEMADGSYWSSCD